MRELILGGARSGKSRLAEQRARDSGLEVVYVATAQAGDDEMAARIAAHRAQRPAGWTTLEAPHGLAAALGSHGRGGRLLLVDCLTLWLANLVHDETHLDTEWTALLKTLPALPGEVVLVSNEVGLGIVPDNALARRFRDAAGRLNQDVAAACERVTFVAGGLPLTLKAPGA
ncbi:MAG: bifunctional adenosylcobinamide kinase/adenosylcobinamide-phosphate guanylyltransferase [Halofilum sp. (in: g-proteobacteria)]|nr:bifunctional adenosylcobinamide kinase/adenosylcobinamide-phosphate guanylyltransferase [Halofilum sp. (in: g-proteobacteria)]